MGTDILEKLKRADRLAAEVNATPDLDVRMNILREMPRGSARYDARRDTRHAVRYCRALWRVDRLRDQVRELRLTERDDQADACELRVQWERGFAAGLATSRVLPLWADASWYRPGMWRRWKAFEDQLRGEGSA